MKAIFITALFYLGTVNATSYKFNRSSQLTDYQNIGAIITLTGRGASYMYQNGVSPSVNGNSSTRHYGKFECRAISFEDDLLNPGQESAVRTYYTCVYRIPDDVVEDN